MSLKTKILGILLLIGFAHQVTAITVLEGSMTNYRNGTVKFEDTRINQVEELRRTNTAKKPDIEIRALSNNKAYWAYSENLSFTKYIMPIGEYRELEKRVSFIRIPLNQTNTTVKFFRDEKLSLTLSPQNLSRDLCTLDQACSAYCSGKKVDPDCTCGDNVCQQVESAEICNQDCGNNLNSEVTQNESQESKNKSEGSGSGIGINIVYGLIIVFTLALGVVWLKSDF